MPWAGTSAKVVRLGRVGSQFLRNRTRCTSTGVCRPLRHSLQGGRCRYSLGKRQVSATANLPQAWELSLLPRQVEAPSRLQRLSAAAARWPVLTAVTCCAIKAAAADLLVQVVVERRDKIDQNRNLMFLGFGGLVQGGFQYWMFNVVFERIWPGSSKLASFYKLAATNFISDPFFLFPAFYTMREASRGGSPGTIVSEALAKYRANCIQDWMMSWCVWLPGHYVTYFWLPVHLRVPWVALASFSYVCALSCVRGGTSD